MMRNGHKIVLEWGKETDEALATFKRNVELQAELWDKIVLRVEKIVTKLETEAERENDVKMV